MNKTMTHSEFTSSVRFLTPERYAKMYSDMYIHPDCEVVVLYKGGFIVQMLKDHVFSVRVNGETFTANNIHNAQSFLWMMEAEKKLSN